VLRRFYNGILSVWLAVTLLFFAMRVLPGDAVESSLIGSGASASVIESRRAALGLDAPPLVQYGLYWFNLLRGDFGISLLNGRPVIEIIAQNLRPTVELAVGAILFAVLFGGGVGLWAAQGGILPRIVIALTQSVPILWTGTLAVYVFAAQLNLLPSGGAGGAASIILPIGVLGFHTSGAIAAVFAAALREANVSDYALVARAKGLRSRHVWLSHLTPNALAPVMTVIGLQFGFLLGGVVVTESLFARPGIGRALLNATMTQDYPVVQGIAVYSALIYLLVMTATDVLKLWIDPRIRAMP